MTRGNGTSFAANGETDDDGFFTTGSLPASGSRGFSVCFAWGLTFGGSYVPSCYDDQPSGDPKNADRIVLEQGDYFSVVGRLAREGKLTGSVVPTRTVAPEDLEVRVYDGDGDVAGVTHPDTSGVFEVYLPPDTDYSAYVRASSANKTPTIWFGGRPGIGYVPGNPFPADVRNFTITGGRVTSAGKVTVPLAGKISGSVQSDQKFTDVLLYATDGALIKTMSLERGKGGGFSITYLRPGSYTVCASQYAAETYIIEQCWDGTKGVAVPRPGEPPSSTVGASVVRAGKTLTGLNFTLPDSLLNPP